MADRWKTVAGNLTTDPVRKETPKGPVTALSVAHNPTRYDPETKKHERTGPTEFYEVSAWGKLGEHCKNSLKRGDRVVVAGVLSDHSFERQDGTQGVSHEISAREVGASLLFTDLAIAPSQGLAGPSL